MQFSSLITASLAACSFASAEVSSPVKQALKHKPARPINRHGAAHRASQAVGQRDSSPYLNGKTEKFAVNGSALPDVDFDIGESYAGLLPIDDTGKELWFWFVPTENPDASNEITIWLNGGPGCSSLDGFFHENGPVTWIAGTYRPVQNAYAWNNLTNVVWIEQPVGTGFSQGTPNATSEVDVADQFRGFWKNFVDTFDLHSRDVYITGESYAGQYCPYIADGFLQQNDTEYFNVKGLMVYDPSIGPDSVTEQAPTKSFVDYHQPLFPFNQTFLAELANISATCGYDALVEEGLTFPPKGYFQEAGIFPNGTTRPECDIFDLVFEAIFELNPCFNIYQVGQLCPIPWDTLGFPYSDFYLPPGYDQPYFNQTSVKEVIHAPIDTNWAICTDINVFPDGDASPPSAANGGPLGRVAEATNNVIVGHGLLDMVLIANGSLITLNNLTWNGAQGFSTPPINDFFVPDHYDPRIESVSGAGIYGKWVTDRGLTFVTIELAGHTVPTYQASAAYRHLEFLLGRVANLSEVSPFSTQPGYPQSRTLGGAKQVVLDA